MMGKYTKKGKVRSTKKDKMALQTALETKRADTSLKRLARFAQANERRQRGILGDDYE